MNLLEFYIYTGHELILAYLACWRDNFSLHFRCLAVCDYWNYNLYKQTFFQSYTTGGIDEPEKNPDLSNVVTPIKVGKLRDLLNRSHFDVSSSQYLPDGFTNGFDLEYNGPMNRKDSAPNIPF